jgi:hypothetical protein
MLWLTLLLSGCFYAKFGGGYAPALGSTPDGVAASFHQGVIGSSSADVGLEPLELDIHWFGDRPITWSYGAFARARLGGQQGQLAIGPEAAVALNPGLYPVVPYAKLGVHLAQIDRYRGAWGGGLGSPLAELGIVSCRFWHDVPCLSLSGIIERDLRLGPAPDSTQLTLMAGAGVGF